jgi:hypothetical protein
MHLEKEGKNSILSDIEKLNFDIPQNRDQLRQYYVEEACNKIFKRH